MPILNADFANGIFFAQEIGTISKEDAEQWVNLLQQYAQSSATPIVAVVDALQVGYVSATARQIFANSVSTPNLLCSCVAAQNVVVSTAGLIRIMSGQNRTHVFPTVEEARAYAEQRLRGAYQS